MLGVWNAGVAIMCVMQCLELSIDYILAVYVRCPECDSYLLCSLRNAVE